MAKYFPMFLDLNGKLTVVVGNSRLARDKSEKLERFGAIVSFIDERVDDISAVLYLNPWAVVVADTSFVNVDVLYTECARRGIPLNVVDVPSRSTFIFPSMSVTQNVTLAVSTGGKSPAAAVKIRKNAEKCMPGDIDAILDWLYIVRSKLNKEFSPSDRRIIMTAAVDEAFKMNRPLNDEETNAIVNRIINE